jgi:hypothetical protein
MKMSLKLICISAIALSCLFIVKSDAVCTESTLVTEILQDIKDNGKLDCLRKPLDPPTDRQESEEEKKRRLEGAWDTGIRIFLKFIRLCFRS